MGTADTEEGEDKGIQWSGGSKEAVKIDGVMRVLSTCTQGERDQT